jgi:hypothetical protein
MPSCPKEIAALSPSNASEGAADDDANNKKREKGLTPIFAPLNRVAREIGGALCLVNDRRRLLARQDAPSLLANRTVERRTPGPHDPRHGPAAARPYARQSFAIVNPERMLKISKLAIGLPVIAQG